MTNKQGWHEKQIPTLTNKGVEQKAPDHRKAAIGSSYQTTLRQPLVSEEEQNFISHPSKYINEFAPLYDQALKTSSIQQKWESRKDYISLIIKKSADHSIKTKEASHFIMYLKEIKEDLKAKEPEKPKSKHNIVYSSVDLPTSNSSSRIFGVEYNDQVFGRVSAFAPTGVYDPKNFKPLPQEEYETYKQWLKSDSKGKTMLDAQNMQWIEDHAEELIKSGLEKHNKQQEGQKEYERAQKLREQYKLNMSDLSIGDRLEFIFDNTKWIVTDISKNAVFAQKSGDNYPTAIGSTIVSGYKLLEKAKKDTSPIDAELQKVQVIIDNFKTREDYNQGMHILGQISIDFHPSISQQEKMREMAQILNKKANELEKQNNSTYDDLVKQIYLAITIQKLDDLHQDANRAEVKGQITFAQLNEIYALINKRDEQLNKEIRARREFLQSQYHVGDILERLPDIDSVIKPGIYKITEIIPHKIMSFGNTSPSELRTEYEYRIAGIKDNTEIRIGGMILTAEHLSNSFKKISSQEVGEMNKSDIETSKKLLFDGIKQIKTIQALNELDTKFRELISKGGLDATSEHVSEITQALSAKRKELSGTNDEYTKKKAEYESKNLEYSAKNIPKELQPKKEYTEEEIRSHVWGSTEAEALQRYATKERAKNQSNIDYVERQRKDLDEIIKSKPHVLLTKAQIQKQYPPEKAEEYIRDLWNYKTLKSSYDKNEQSVKFWRSKVEKIDSGEWQKINTNYLREQYKKEVTKAISKGMPVPISVINQHSEFTKAKDNRDRYNKGYKTSFANKSIAVDESTKLLHGVKIKRQDGKAMTKLQEEEIISDLNDIKSVLGDITPILKKEDLTISHTSGKMPFLSQAGGMYHPSEKTVTVGTGTHASAHEIAHALDHASRKTDEPLYNFQLLGIAKATMNTGAERAMSLSHKEGEELKKARFFRSRLTLKYWTRPEEIFARLIEQYVAYKHPQYSTAHYSFKEYTEMPAWWPESAFMEMLPLIQSEIERKLKLANQ